MFSGAISANRFCAGFEYDNWDGLKPEWKANWRDQRGPAGAGVLFDLGSHLFDLARHVLGPIDSAIGFTDVVPRTRPDESTGAPVAVETDDLVNAWLQYESGAHGQIAVSRVTPSFAQNGWLEVVGPEGALKAALSRGAMDSLKFSSPLEPDWKDLPLPPEAADRQPHGLGLMMRSFVDACLRGHSDAEADATFRMAQRLSMQWPQPRLPKFEGAGSGCRKFSCPDGHGSVLNRVKTLVVERRVETIASNTTPTESSRCNVTEAARYAQSPPPSVR